MLDDTIRAGEWVMLKLPSGNSKIFVLKADERVELGKFGSFDSNNLIGRHQLVPYEVVGDGNIRPVENLDYLQEFDLGDTEEDASNMTIVDDPTSQRLTHQEIEELKSQSLEGKVDHSAVIQKIVQNNAAFEKKTDFAKAKYIQRKQRKFAKIFTPIKPTTRLFCDFYLAKKPEKTREMRIDTLSQIMTFANVRAGSRFLVVDDASGLIVGAMLERMHEHGKIFALHDKETPNFDLVRMLNFSDEVMSLERTRDDILAGAFDG
nr:tRNA (adenine(58)-N(1))-methyltransferase non-catalytic subunit trm6 [Polyrhizophydium stewartii]